MTSEPCPFCEIVTDRAPALYLAAWDDAVAIRPLEPVTPGHVLIIPRVHVRDFAENPAVTAMVAQRAAEYAQDSGASYNLITSKDREATQSVFHLHLHLVPRAENDRLALPWHSGKHTRTPS